MKRERFNLKEFVAVLLLTALFSAGVAHAEPPAPHNASSIPPGTNQTQILCGTNQITVFTYKPQTYRDGPLIVVFHGRSRNAQDYRDHAMALADRLNAVVAAPLFDLERFPVNDYNLGGMIQNNAVQPHENLFFNNIETVVEALRRQEGKPDLDYYLIGHSAGGQMLMRMAAFNPLKAKRIIAANPGSDLFPRRDWKYGYGFGGLPGALSDDAALQRYLAAPLTLYLGTADTLTDQDNLDRSDSAMRQGKNRLERGRNCFEFAESLAHKRGWRFNWRKVEVTDIAHDGKGMLAAKEAEDALFGRDK